MSDNFSQIDLSKIPEINQEEPEKEEPQEQPKEKTLGEVLQAFHGAPDDAQIEKWKVAFGEILCSTLSEVELFIFRPISRQEWLNLQAYIAQAQQQNKPVSASDVESKVVETCVLWASPPGVDSLDKKAGTIGTLNEQIMQQSNFVNPAYASQFVVKL